MHKLPENFDTGFLVGGKLEMICFNANQIYFHFNGEISLVTESSILYADSAEAIETKIDVPIKESGLMALIEHTIVQAKANSLGTLTIEFDNRAVLKFIDVSPHYESYKIVQGDRITVV